MNILITGSMGNIGSSTLAALQGRGHRITCFDLPTRVNRRLAKRLPSDVRMCWGDIRQAADIAAAVVNQEVVVHLAAQAGVRHSVKSPMDFVKSNLNGFANVLDACKKYEVQEFLYASSSSVYGARTDAPFQETDRCDTPESFYAATKMANELMAQAYFAQYKTPSLGLRFFTVYGPWGRLDMAPLLFAQKMRKKQPIQLFGDGLLKRDFTYVEDTIFALSRLIELGISRHGVDVVNVGHSNPIQVTEFVKILSECLGIEPVVELAPMQVSDVPLTCASDLKLVKLIGEWPHTSMKDGLTEMAKWLLNWQPA